MTGHVSVPFTIHYMVKPMKTQRKVLVMAAFSLSAALICAQDASAYRGTTPSPANLLLAAASPTSADSNFAVANVSDQLNILEKFLFDKNYLDQTHSERLDRLEMMVFHAHQNGSDSERLKKLIAALPADSQTKVVTAITNLVAAEPTANPIAPAVAPASTGALTNTDQLSALERFFFESTYSNESTEDRLARIEILLFGAPKTGTDVQRLANVIAALPADAKAQIIQSTALDVAVAGSVSPSTAQTAPPANPVMVGQVSTQVGLAQPESTPSASDITTAAQPAQTASQPQTSTIFAALQNLVKKYYPEAKITVSGTKMHFEYKCKTEIGYYSQKRVYAPQEKGILGDIAVEPGEYNKANKNRLPSEVPDGFHTNLTMAPYASSLNEYLLTHLSFPTDVNLKFKGRFESIINGFKAQDQQAKAAAIAASRLAVAEHNAAAKAAAQQQAQQAKVAAQLRYEATYGAANMSMQSFPDGQFRIMMPDTIQTKPVIEAHAAGTEYSAQAAGGSFQVSYFNLPSLPASSAQSNALFDKFTGDTLKQVNASSSSQAFVSLDGSPGREILVNSINGSPSKGAMIKLYLVDLSTYDTTGTLNTSTTTSTTSSANTMNTSANGGHTTHVSGNVSNTTTNGTGAHTTNVTNQGGGTTNVINRSSITPIETLVTPKYMLYELVAVGDNQWVDSWAVRNFMTSFQTDFPGKQHAYKDSIQNWGTGGHAK